MRRKNFGRIIDINRFKHIAEKWERVDHEYNKVNKLVDWTNNQEQWAHKGCKGKFFKTEFLNNQEPITTVTNATPAETEVETTPENNCEIPDVRKSARKQYKYESSWKEEEKKRCIICNEDKKEKGRLIPLTTISIVDKAEETLEEYAEIHIKNKNQKYLDGAKRIHSNSVYNVSISC